MRRASNGLRHMVALISGAALLCHFATAEVFASPDGDACGKDICLSAGSSCLRADQKLNPSVRTAAEKQSDCAKFFHGCMMRGVMPDVPW